MLEKEFRAELKGGNIRNAYFFYGDEEYLKRFARKTLRGTVIDDESFDSFNRAVFSAAVTSPSELREPLSVFPFMSEKRLVEYIDADLSLFTGNKLAELKELLSDSELFESSVLCIISAPEGFDFPKKAAEKKFNDTINKDLASLLTTVFFNTPTPGELAKWVARHMEHNGVHCSPDIARMIIARSGKSMDRLALETDKLSCYVLSKGRNEVAADDLSAISLADPELAAFALSNAILSFRTADALEALDASKRDKEKPTVVLAGITGAYADMLVVKELAAGGCTDSEISSRTGINEYRAKLSRNAAASVSKAMLEKALALCIECDSLLKSSFGNSYGPIERLVCELAVLRRQDGV